LDDTQDREKKRQTKGAVPEKTRDRMYYMLKKTYAGRGEVKTSPWGKQIKKKKKLGDRRAKRKRITGSRKKAKNTKFRGEERGRTRTSTQIMEKKKHHGLLKGKHWVQVAIGECGGEKPKSWLHARGSGIEGKKKKGTKQGSEEN